MNHEIEKRSAKVHVSPFERIRRVNDAGNEFWASRDLAEVLGYGDYRNFEAVIEKARAACFTSGQRVEDHFVDVTEMIEIGKGRVPLAAVTITVLFPQTPPLFRSGTLHADLIVITYQEDRVPHVHPLQG